MEEEVGWGLEACTEVEQLDLVLEVRMVAELAGVTVPVVLVVMLVHAGSPMEKSAHLAESVAVMEDPDQVLCHTMGLAKEGDDVQVNRSRWRFLHYSTGKGFHLHHHKL